MVDTIRTKEYGNFVGKLRKARLEAGLRQIDVAKKFIQAEVNEMPVLKKGKVVGVINQGILLRQLKIK